MNKQEKSRQDKTAAAYNGTVSRGLRSLFGGPDCVVLRESRWAEAEDEAQQEASSLPVSLIGKRNGDRACRANFPGTSLFPTGSLFSPASSLVVGPHYHAPSFFSFPLDQPCPCSHIVLSLLSSTYIQKFKATRLLDSFHIPYLLFSNPSSSFASSTTHHDSATVIGRALCHA